MKANNTATLVAVLFFTTSLTDDVLAQAVVRDSNPLSTNTPQTQPSVEPITVDSAPAVQATTNLAYQIQQLQQEVSELRGLLEKQSFELQRLKKQRLDDYLDLDKRLTQLAENMSTPSSTPNPIGGPEADTQISQSDKALYREAIDLLLSQQNYSSAREKFDEYLKNYPAGTYVPNVYYWQGQILLTENDVKTAEKFFKSLIDNYPDHQKVPDAKYKLATIYFDQGRKSDAKSLLNEVASSNSDVAPLAKSFLSNQFN